MLNIMHRLFKKNKIYSICYEYKSELFNINVRKISQAI